MKLPIDKNNMLKVTAVDYNGKEWDGTPLVQVGNIPDWARGNGLIDHGLTLVESKGCDYAWFGFKDEYGNVTWAGPGDYIVKLNPTDKYLMVIPGKFMDRLLSMED